MKIFQQKRKTTAFLILGTFLFSQIPLYAATLTINGTTGTSTSEIVVPAAYQGFEGSLVATTNDYALSFITKVTSPSQILYSVTNEDLSKPDTILMNNYTTLINSLEAGIYVISARAIANGAFVEALAQVKSSYIIVYGLDDSSGNSSGNTTEDGKTIVIVNNGSDNGVSTLITHLLEYIGDIQQMLSAEDASIRAEMTEYIASLQKAYQTADANIKGTLENEIAMLQNLLATDLTTLRSSLEGQIATLRNQISGL